MNMDWYQKSMNAHALSGKADRTQEAYSRALHMLCNQSDLVPLDSTWPISWTIGHPAGTGNDNHTSCQIPASCLDLANLPPPVIAANSPLHA